MTTTRTSHYTICIVSVVVNRHPEKFSPKTKRPAVNWDCGRVNRDYEIVSVFLYEDLI